MRDGIGALTVALCFAILAKLSNGWQNGLETLLSFTFACIALYEITAEIRDRVQ